jgi:aspartate-semialdehyde dehydrogenase
MRVAIVGATGAVGQELSGVLAQRGFQADEFRLLASKRSAGKTVDWCGQPTKVHELNAKSLAGIDVAFFSAGAGVSREFAPRALQAGAIVVDNSSAFRMQPDVPLIVPAINADAICDARLLAVPNCSAIILLMPLAPLHRVNPLVRVVVSTYQAVSGAGARAVDELRSQAREVLAGQAARPAVFPEPCAFNVFSHNTPIGPDGLNVEETKMIAESRKILGHPQLRMAPTCMRVPVVRAHLESVTAEFSWPITAEQAREILTSAACIRVVDDASTNRFPTSLLASGQDDVLVGRIRRDASDPRGHTLQFICAGDQLRIGAALTAVQIGELALQRATGSTGAEVSEVGRIGRGRMCHP